MKNKPGKILAIDFGSSKAGLAVCDESGEFVFGRGIVKDFKNLDNFIKLIGELCVREGVKKIVMGLPLGKLGGETPQSARIRKIGEKLGKKLNISVLFEDESFSTYEAKAAIEKIPGGISEKVNDDEMSAILILRKYIDKLGLGF